MLTQQQVATFQEQGYLRGGRVLSDAQVDELRAEVERVIADREKPVKQPVSIANIARNAGGVVWQIVNICNASAPFAALVRNQQIAEEIAQLSGGKEIRLWHDQVQFKPAETGGVNMWHQDWPYWGILDAPHQVSAWVALDDVDPDNGCMSMVPGSHRWGNNIEALHKIPAFDQVPAEYEGRPLTVKTCPVSKGEVHYHHGLTWHGSPANKSGRPRRAVALHYMTEQTRYKAAGSHLMKKFVTVADGAKFEGAAFPLVYERR
ncbi:MAG: phytanoyl-CoA dioxygenase family protein [Verrucomicrobiota bacterium]